MQLQSPETPKRGDTLPAPSTPKTTGAGPMDIVEMLLQEQQTLTAVDRFAQVHQRDGLADESKYYRDLIPAAAPTSGEQYAFEVDLDACSGCKACVTACHALNGLEDD